MLNVTIQDRPYVLTFLATGTSYPISADEARRILESYPALKATRNRVVLPGHNTNDPKQRVILQPATLGGGPAFTVTKE